MTLCGVQPVDRCWHMAAIAFVAQLLMSFTDRCSGFLFVGYMDAFQVDRQQAGWPQSVAFVVNFSAGLLVSVLQTYFSLTRVAVFGAILTWIGPIAASAAGNIAAVTVCMGLIHGLGSGIFFVAISISLMMHFDRYRGIASGIKNLGGTAASVVLPNLMLFIQGHYGFRACLLLYGGLAMHLTALGMLTKEPPWTRRSYPSASSNSAATSRDLHGDYTRACDQGDEEIHCEEAAGNSKKLPRDPGLGLRELFVNPVFYVIALSGVIGYYTQNIFFATIVDFARDKGFSFKESAGVMLYFGFTETVGRLCFPLAADRGLIRHNTLMAFSFVAMAASMILLERGGTLLALTAGASLFAASFGTAVTVEGVVIVNYLGVDNLSFVFGFTGAISVPFFFANPFILGFFRDHVGSYQHLYKILAASYLLAGLTWMSILWCERYSYSFSCRNTTRGTAKRVKPSETIKRLSHETTKWTDVVSGEVTSSV